MVKKENLGFTTLELLVVLVIMGISLGIAISAYNDFNRRQIVTQAAKKVKNYLRLAQSKALAGEKDCNSSYCDGESGKCTPASKSLEGWFVNFSSKRVYGRCGGVVFGEVPFMVSGDITLQTVPASTVVQFFPLNTGATETTICVSKSGIIYKLRTIRAGEIKEDGIVSTCS